VPAERLPEADIRSNDARAIAVLANIWRALLHGTRALHLHEMWIGFTLWGLGL